MSENLIIVQTIHIYTHVKKKHTMLILHKKCHYCNGLFFADIKLTFDFSISCGAGTVHSLEC